MLGCSYIDSDTLTAGVEKIRSLTNNPIALNFLLFYVDEEKHRTAIDLHPASMSYAWSSRDQDLKPYMEQAHDVGATVVFMVGDVEEAERAAEAGADIIIAQGTEGGGHVSWMASMVLIPMVVDTVAPLPVMAAGGIADGRGLAAALSLGAEGVLLGTRFLASEESPLHKNFKQAILDSDGHDTDLSEIPDIALGRVWPGAMSRALRNNFIEKWAGREWFLRQNQNEALAAINEARKTGDADNAPLLIGQDAGLINDLSSSEDIVSRIVSEAEEILSSTLPNLIK